MPSKAEVVIARANPDFDAGDKYLDRELAYKGKPVKMSEGDFTRIILYAGRMFYGWRMLHIRPAMRLNGEYVTPVSGDGEGFPDINAIRACTGDRFVSELKVGRNKTTDDQDDWLNDCEACGIPAFVWYPQDVEEIKRVLRTGN